MDFSSLTSNIQMNKIDRISVTFFRKYALATSGKMSELGKQRFLDNLFYSFANCSTGTRLIDLKRDRTHSGSLGQLTDLLEQLIEKDKESPGQDCLEIEFDQQAGIPDDSSDFLTKFAENHSFLKHSLKSENAESIRNSLANFIAKVCEKYQNVNIGADEEALAKGFSIFLENYHRENDFIHPEANFESAVNINLNSQIDKFKAKISEFFPVNLEQSLDEISRTIERKLNSFYKNLTNLSIEISAVSKHSDFSKLKNEFNVMQEALKNIKRDIRQPLTKIRVKDTIQEANPIHFEDKNIDAEAEGEEPVPFFAFYRVKSVSKNRRISKNTRKGSKNTSVRSIKTFEYGFSELGSSDSVSYHICDDEGKTISHMDEFSDDTSSKALPTVNKPAHQIARDLLIKKNQSLNQFDSKESYEEQFSRTIDLRENPEIFKATQESIIFRPSEPSLKTLDLEIEFFRKHIKVLNINPEDYIDLNIGEWKIQGEKNLEEKLQNLLASQSAVNVLMLENVALHNEIKDFVQKLKDLETRQLDLCPIKELMTLEQKYQSCLSKIKEMNLNNEKLQSESLNLEHLLKAAQLLNHQQEEASNASALKASKLLSDLRSNIILKTLKIRTEVSNLRNEVQEIPNIFKLLEKFRALFNLHHQQENLKNDLKDSIVKANALLETSHHKQSHYMSLLEEKDRRTAFYQSRLKTLNESIENFNSTIQTLDSINLSRVIKSINSLIAANKQLIVQRDEKSKLVKELQTDYSDLKYINGNLLKELQILSTSQELLSRDKDTLEELLRLKEELDEKNKEMSLTIQMLQEKLEMSNSLREMAERKLNSIEDNESPFDKYHKTTPEIFTHDYNFNRHLGTIDENEELIEISDEPSPAFRETTLAIVIDDRFKIVDPPSHKTLKLEIVKSYSLKFNYFSTTDNKEKTSQGKLKMQKSSSFDFRNHFRTDSDTNAQKNSLYYDKMIQSDTKFERQNNDDNDSSSYRLPTNKNEHEDSHSMKDKNTIADPEKRSQGKRSLFSMENVLKSIGDVSKNDQNPSFPKPIGEFNTNEERMYRSHVKQSRLRNSLINQEEFQESRKPSREISNREASTPRSKRLDKSLVTDNNHYHEEQFKRLLKGLLRKFHILTTSVNEQKSDLESKLKGVQEKLINVELLQNIHKDIREDNYDEPYRRNLLGSPKEMVQISLTDRMKFKNEQKNYNTADMKLFAKGTKHLPNVNITIPEPNHHSDANDINSDTKFTQLRLNYGNVAVKSNTMTQIDEKITSIDSRTKTNKNSGLSNKKGNYRKSQDEDLDYDMYAKRSTIQSADDFGQQKSQLKLSTNKDFTQISPHRSDNVIMDQISSKDLNATSAKDLEVNEANVHSRISEASNLNAHAEFELVEKAYFKILVDAKKISDNQIVEITNQYKTEKYDLLTQLNNLKSSNDSLKIESIKLLGENENLNDENCEFRRIIERAFDLAKALVSDLVESEVINKPEHIDKVLETAKVQFENYQAMLEVMDEEIRVLKGNLLPFNVNRESGNDSIEIEQKSPSIKSNFMEIRRNVSKKNLITNKLTKKKVFDLNTNEYDSNYESNNPNNQVISNGSSSRDNQLYQNMRSLVNDIRSKHSSRHSSRQKFEDIQSPENVQPIDKSGYNASINSYNESQNNFEIEHDGTDNVIVEEEEVDDPNITSFSQKQRVLKEGFYELLNNIMMVIDENKNYVSKALMRIASSNSEPIMRVHHSIPELQSMDPQSLKSISPINMDLDLIKNNNLHLKEMVEFLTKNLMMFLEELEELNLDTKTFPRNQQIDELEQENEFLYQKLNESHREKESLKKLLDEINEKYPETTKLEELIGRRSLSVPLLPPRQEDEVLQNSDIHRYQEKIQELIDFRNNGYQSIGPVDEHNIKIQHHLDNNGKPRPRLITEKASYTDEHYQNGIDHQDHDGQHEEHDSNRLEETENYNMFLLNILRQIKLIIDDNTSSSNLRFSRLEEISRDLDTM